jgi:endonuclease YncB( thermonuclease family)
MGNCLCDNNNQLKENVLPLGFHNKVFIAYVHSVYDGDTCTLNIKSDIGMYQWKVRLEGIDAPELKSSNHLGVECKQVLTDLILHKFIIIKCGKWEKYGRLLGTLYIRPNKQSCQTSDMTRLNQLLCINTWMLEHTRCVAYHGKGKKFTVE